MDTTTTTAPLVGGTLGDLAAALRARREDGAAGTVRIEVAPATLAALGRALAALAPAVKADEVALALATLAHAAGEAQVVLEVTDTRRTFLAGHREAPVGYECGQGRCKYSENPPGNIVWTQRLKSGRGNGCCDPISTEGYGLARLLELADAQRAARGLAAGSLYLFTNEGASQLYAGAFPAPDALTPLRTAASRPPRSDRR